MGLQESSNDYYSYINKSYFESKLYFGVFKNKIESRGTEQQQQQTYQFTQGYSILHRLQLSHHLTLTFIIHNKYISTLYLYTYIQF